LWKLGQLRAGDKIQFSCVSIADAVKLEAQQKEQINALTFSETVCEQVIPKSPIIEVLDATQFGDTITYRAAGDHFLLVEYGEQVLDIRLRFRAHALMQWLQKNPTVGLRELTPGIRSLQIHYDSQKISLAALLSYLKQAEEALSQSLGELTVPSRIVNIPLSWDDIACRQAIEKYDQSVRSNAPWSPSNLEFIRRINGLASIDDVKKIVFDASYLVMGLGDVYLGAPVATPIDPRHRLVTTKYNPARTWTAENSVGIGGSYMCVYGMEGPGGYQFVGRTLQMWNRYRQTKEFENPWLLRFFDQIRFYEVSHDELQKIRKDFPLGQYPLEIEQGHFSLSEYEQTLKDNAGEIDDFKCQRNSAFEQELARWHTDGQFNYKAKEQAVAIDEVTWPEESIAVDSPVSGSVWQVESCVGDRVEAGQVMMILESMKMEIPVVSPVTGTVTHVLLSSGGRINAGQPLIVIEEQA
jgi:urea carboxylase